jgi:pimeloyl-ACP methyl ester carboxylesterase
MEENDSGTHGPDCDGTRSIALVLLPGMDGTGKLFSWLLDALPGWILPRPVQSPVDAELSFSDLLLTAQSAIPSDEPFVLLAESFSTPIAVRIAAARPSNLRALVICAGFVASPVRGPLRLLLSFLAPGLFRFGVPDMVVSGLLLGKTGSRNRLRSVSAAISSVSPRVLSHRLRAVLECDEMAELEKVVVPILYIRAGKDRLVGESSLPTILRVRPNTSLARIIGPHLILQAEPQRADDALVNFLQHDW